MLKREAGSGMVGCSAAGFEVSLCRNGRGLALVLYRSSMLLTNKNVTVSLVNRNYWRVVHSVIQRDKAKIPPTLSQ